MRGISWLAASRLASQEGLCTMEWVSCHVNPKMGLVYLSSNKVFRTALSNSKYLISRIWVCGLSYPACKVPSPNSIAWPEPKNFSILSHNCHKFLSVERKTRFDFLYVCLKYFRLLWKIQHDIIKNVRRSSYKVSIVLSDFNKTWIFRQDFFAPHKSSNMKFRENPSIWSREFLCGELDRQT